MIEFLPSALPVKSSYANAGFDVSSDHVVPPATS